MHDLSAATNQQLEELLRRYKARLEITQGRDHETMVKAQIVGGELATRVAMAEIRKDLETLSIVVAPAA